ncbi:hypothetical protein [Blastomonas fulva]|uniref:hypothetical protein n=1 Tax=Blastomonas fulva TaxID=1550728 RepID=UPI003F6F904D
MTDTVIRKTAKWIIPATALLGGMLLGQSGWLEPAANAQTAESLTPLERLLIQDDIRQKIVLYGLYADGDGPGGRPRDLRTLAYTMMTPDVVSEIHLVTGGKPLIFTGRELVANTPPEIDPELAATVGGRHYLIDTVFDEVTPTRVRTRTPAVYFDATKNLHGAKCRTMGPDACGQKPVKTVMWVYEQTWVKTPDGWQIKRNILRDDN